jgi:hypothetical protein
MKRLLFTAFLFLALHTNGQAQEFGFSTTFQLIEAKSWNKSTQTYNFSRPFLTNQQPLLKCGATIGLYYLPRPENRLAYGPALSFSFHRSAADNPGLKVGINAFLLDVGLRMQMRPGSSEDNPLRLSFTPSLKGVMLSRRVNGEIAVIGKTEEDLKVRQLGAGLGLNMQLSYDLPINNGWAIAPLIGAHYDPIVWANRSELVFNQATVGDLKSSTSIWGIQAGIIMKKVK